MMDAHCDSAKHGFVTSSEAASFSSWTHGPDSNAAAAACGVGVLGQTRVLRHDCTRSAVGRRAPRLQSDVGGPLRWEIWFEFKGMRRRYVRPLRAAFLACSLLSIAMLQNQEEADGLPR